MKIHEAIEKAIEGGYGVLVRPYIKPLVLDVSKMEAETWRNVLDFIESNHLEEKIFLDPLFWQAMGKAMGWGGKTGEHFEQEKFKNGKVKSKCSSCGDRWPYRGNFCWLYHWHCLIDWLAEGKSVESFFEELK